MFVMENRIAEIDRMNQIVLQNGFVSLTNLNATTIDVFKKCGYVMVTMTVVMVLTKEIAKQKNPASYAKEPNSVAMIIDNAFLEVFNAMERTTAMMARMKLVAYNQLLYNPQKLKSKYLKAKPLN